MDLHVLAVEFNFSDESERYYVEVISHNVEIGHTSHKNLMALKKISIFF